MIQMILANMPEQSVAVDMDELPWRHTLVAHALFTVAAAAAAAARAKKRDDLKGLRKAVVAVRPQRLCERVLSSTLC